VFCHNYFSTLLWNTLLGKFIKPDGTEIAWDTTSDLADEVNLLEGNVETIKKNVETLIDASKEVGIDKRI
jgi:hypothetical protein